MRNKSMFLLIMLITCFTTLYATVDKFMGEKMYIDDEEFNAQSNSDSFHIHIGNNVWLVTHSVHRDARGLFSYECNLSRSMNGTQLTYEKQWKCPYCYCYWPIGKPCSNKDCPSRYK